MAQYRCSVSHGSKKGGQSGGAKSDYINRKDKYSNERKLEDLRYSKSGNMPSFAKDDPSQFWKQADIQGGKNDRLYSEFQLNLPRELDLEQQKELIHKFIDKTINNEDRQLPYSYAIHNDKNNNNPHVHLIFHAGKQDGIDRPAETYFKQYRQKNIEQGGVKRDEIWTNRDKGKEFLLNSREIWAKETNLALEKQGIAERVDHRSLKAQGIDRIPQIHVGVNATEMAKRLNIKADRQERNNEIKQANSLTAATQKVAAVKEPIKKPLIDRDRFINRVEKHEQQQQKPTDKVADFKASVQQKTAERTGEKTTMLGQFTQDLAKFIETSKKPLNNDLKPKDEPKPRELTTQQLRDHYKHEIDKYKQGNTFKEYQKAEQVYTADKKEFKAFMNKAENLNDKYIKLDDEHKATKFYQIFKQLKLEKEMAKLQDQYKAEITPFRQDMIDKYNKSKSTFKALETEVNTELQPLQDGFSKAQNNLFKESVKEWEQKNKQERELKRSQKRDNDGLSL